IERWRSGKWRRTGMLWWNLRDGWPIISDAIVDYYNRKKLAYAYVRRLQADVAAMLGEPEDGTQTVWVANDTRSPAAGTVVVRDADTAEPLFDSVVHVPANESMAVGCVSLATAPSLRLLEWRGEGGVAANHYLAGPRPFKLADYARWMLKMGLDDTLAAVRYAAELA
ncbi:MAG: glycoside hydrolase family 2, partial [Armatimonadetes bacterium]|nr:glycoside hydrolase family 2 [Armatimonadota bacterium]